MGSKVEVRVSNCGFAVWGLGSGLGGNNYHSKGASNGQSSAAINGNLVGLCGLLACLGLR